MKLKEPLTPLRFAKMKRLYWVLDQTNDQGPQWKYWINHPGDAPPPPNEGMTWRRPTYDEALLRQWYFENDREHYMRELEDVQKFATHLRRLWRKTSHTEHWEETV